MAVLTRQSVEDDLTVPLQLFADCEGKNGDLLSIRLGEPARLSPAWDEGELPQYRVYQFADDASIPKMPPTSSM